MKITELNEGYFILKSESFQQGGKVRLFCKIQRGKITQMCRDTGILVQDGARIKLSEEEEIIVIDLSWL